MRRQHQAAAPCCPARVAVLALLPRRLQMAALLLLAKLSMPGLAARSRAVAFLASLPALRELQMSGGEGVSLSTCRLRAALPSVTLPRRANLSPTTTPPHQQPRCELPRCLSRLKTLTALTLELMRVPEPFEGEEEEDWWDWEDPPAACVQAALEPLTALACLTMRAVCGLHRLPPAVCTLPALRRLDWLA